MNAQDFISGVDFTGLASIEGSDINNGINGTVPQKEADDTTGRGLVVTTTDTNLDTPDVPNPNTAGFTRFKRFVWVRRPFVGAVDKSIKIYGWNDDVIADPVYLQWIAVSVDLTALSNLANNALATADNAVSIAEVANTTANTSNTNATAATAAATTATNTATNAQTVATAANTLASTANNTANTALTTANSAVTLNSTPLDIKVRLLPPATAWQQIRAKSDVSAVEWFSPKDYYIKVTESYVKGTDNPVAANVGKNTRLLNIIDNNTGGFVTHNTVTGLMTFQVAGVYRIKAWSIINRSGGSPLNSQLIIANNGSGNTILTGMSMSLANGNTNNVVCAIEGLITVAANDVIRLDHYLSTATGVTLGKAANVHPDAGGAEVYSCMQLEFLGV